MTAPVGPQDSLIAQLRAIGIKRGYSPAMIDQKLMDAGLIQAPPQQSMGGGMMQGLMHGAGLAARGIGQGLGAAGDILSQLPPPYGAGGMLPPGTMANAAGGAMNRMGVPQPQTPGERIGVSAAEGATMGGPFGAGAGVLGAGANAAGQAAGEMGASPLGQMAVSAGVGFGLPVAGALLSGGIRAALAGAAERRAAAEQSLQLIQAGNPDAAVTLGQVAEGGAARTIEGGLKNIPGAGSVFAKTLDKQADEMGKRVEAIANKLGRPASTEVVGATIKRGIEGSPNKGPRLAAFDAGVAQENVRLAQSGVIPTEIKDILAKLDNLGFESPLRAANEILGEQRPGGWTKYWDLTDATKDDISKINQWRDQLITKGPVAPPAGSVVAAPRIEHGFIPNFKATAEQLYQKVYNLVPPNSPIRPTAVTQLIAKQNDMLGMAREMSDNITTPGFAKILNNIASAAESGDGRIPFAVLKEQRSRLGAMLSGEELIPDINLRDVKRLYGAITEDMSAGIQEIGGAPATQAWNRANTFWQKGTDRIEKVLDPLVRKRTPEQAFTALMSGTKDGATALRSTLQSLDAGSRGLVRAHVLRQLGRMPDESFSPELFLRKLNGLAPTAKVALFEGEEGVGNNLQALAKIAEERKASGRVMFNPSGTAQNTAFFAILNGMTKLGSIGAGALAGLGAGGGAGAAAGAVATPIVANQLAERVFTNPRMIQWLVRQTRVPFGAMRQELALLAKDSQKWGPADQSVAQDLSSTLSGLDWRSILMAQAAADASATRQP